MRKQFTKEQIETINRKPFTKEQIETINFFANLAVPSPVVGDHLTDEEIAGYFFSLMEEEELVKAEQHLDSCLPCAEALMDFEQLVQARAKESQAAFDALTEEEKRQTLEARLASLQAAEKEAQDRLAALQQQLEEAENLQDLAAKIFGAVKGAFDSLKTLLNPGAALGFAGAAADDSQIQSPFIDIKLQSDLDPDFKSQFDPAVKVLHISTKLQVQGFKIRLDIAGELFQTTFEQEPFSKIYMASVDVAKAPNLSIQSVRIVSPFGNEYLFVCGDGNES
ncbi:MAG: hypothetical protein KIT45_05005 [Fimbriimonadia bacterium]|nr:hypothetical protein [Fimbriimonadia bacterium]